MFFSISLISIFLSGFLSVKAMVSSFGGEETEEDRRRWAMAMEIEEMRRGSSSRVAVVRGLEWSNGISKGEKQEPVFHAARKNEAEQRSLRENNIVRVVVSILREEKYDSALITRLIRDLTTFTLEAIQNYLVKNLPRRSHSESVASSFRPPIKSTDAVIKIALRRLIELRYYPPTPLNFWVGREN